MTRIKKKALALHNKYYKDDLEVRRSMQNKKSMGRNARRQQVLKETKLLELNFEMTQPLTQEEEKEWEEVFRLAEAGDKKRKAKVKEITLVKELTQLQYVLAVWRNGEDPEEVDEEEGDMDDDEEETQTKKAPEPLHEAHFMGYTYNPVLKTTTKVGPLSFFPCPRKKLLGSIGPYMGSVLGKMVIEIG
jgi:hypothetical protein